VTPIAVQLNAGREVEARPMTLQQENRWLKAIVLVMFLAGVFGVVLNHHARSALVVAADQQTRLWQLRCGFQQQMAVHVWDPPLGAMIAD
jgi:hypothetical protein